MGVGRRMKKQGPPEKLSEEHFAKLKRKAGLPVDETPASEAPNKKRRRASDSAQKANGANAKKAKDGPKRKVTGANKVSALTQNGKDAKKSKKAKQPEPDDDEISDGIGEGLEDLDMEDDEFDLEGADSDEGGATLGDDFLGGSDEDDSVYDSDEERKQQAMFSDDEEGSDIEEKLTAANIVGLSRKLDQEQEQEEEDARAELEEMALQTNIEKPHVLPDSDDDDDLAMKTQSILAPDLQMLRTRITDTIRVLDDFSNLSEEGRSRAEYTGQLLKDICAYYGYSDFLAEKLFNLFSPREAFAFFEANEQARPVVIRTNTLRTHRRDLAQALINRGVTLEPVGKWSKVGLQIFESGVPLGATPEYLAGHYILQAASSFLPVMALQPQENERVLDMAAAPGGKTTHMAAMMKNTGCIFANDPSKARAKGLIGNIHRLGARNTIVCNHDARDFPKVIGGFDRVLLDAPCSGTGVIAKDQSVKTNKTEKDFMVLPHTQKQLLLCAIDSVNHHSKTGGFIVYSTCSVTVEENEQVVQYALSKRPNVKLVSTELPFGREGFTSFMGKNFDPSLSLTRRYYPHSYNVDGFYVAKFQKIGPTPGNVKDSTKSGSSAPKAESESATAEVYDKTPIANDEKSAAAAGVEADGFGGFDDDEDAEYMEKAKRNAMRKRGLNPKALDKGQKAAEAAGSASEKEGSGNDEKKKTKKPAAAGGKKGKDAKSNSKGGKAGGGKKKSA